MRPFGCEEHLWRLFVGGSVASLATSRSTRSNHSGETSSPFSSFLRAPAGSQEEAARTAAAEAPGTSGQTSALKQQADKALADFRQSVSNCSAMRASTLRIRFG